MNVLRPVISESSVNSPESVAELGSAMLCADLRISAEPRPDHAQYLAHWLNVLKADKRAIFTAASKASQAASWLGGQQGASAPIAPDAAP